MAPISSGGPPAWTGAGPTGSTNSVIFSPAHTRFMTATRSAMPRMVCVAGSAPTASIVLNPAAHADPHSQPPAAQHVPRRQRLGQHHGSVIPNGGESGCPIGVAKPGLGWAIRVGAIGCKETHE